MSNKKKKSGWVKRLVIIAVSCLLFILFMMIGINVYVGMSSKDYIADDIKDVKKGVSAIIVPGAGLESDGTPGVVLKDRLDTAIELFKAGVATRILVSGDHGDDYHNEALAMKDYVIEKGLPADAVFMDHAGFTTYETMYRARDIFGVTSCVIVTQEYHMYRSIYIARGLGLDAYGMPSDIHIDLKYLPLEAREFLARIKAFFMVMFKPEPTYLGDEIPISGSGSLTDD